MHRDLVERAIGGDEAAFTALVREMADHLYAVAYRIVRDSGRAEDATQQAFLNMWRNFGRLRDPDRFDGWAYRLVVNACYAELRQRRRWIAAFAAVPRDQAEPDTAVTVANRDELRRGFERISAEQRAAVVLHHYGGPRERPRWWSSRSSAAIHPRTESTAKSVRQRSWGRPCRVLACPRGPPAGACNRARGLRRTRRASDRGAAPGPGGSGVLNPVNYFSYFTIQSNLIAVAALLVGAATWRGNRSRGVDLFRGAGTSYMTLTFIVFALLLADTDVDTAIVWVDRVLHRVIPIVTVADRVIDPPSHTIRFRRALWWLAYPLIWLAYVLVRGPIADWYPYPFLDPANGGYGVVLAYGVAIFVAMLVIVWGIVAAGNAMTARRSQGSFASAG